jgi:hypothetical protein
MAANQTQKDLTTEYAKNIAGVKGVRNEIVASKGLGTAGETQSVKIDNAPITAPVKGSLLAHR